MEILPTFGHNHGFVQQQIHMFSICSPLELEALKVGTLINHEQGCWRLDIIDQILNEDDKQVVISHALFQVFEYNEYKLVWHLTSSGEYTIKLAYHHLLEKMIQNQGLRISGNWMHIWKLQIPPKVKYKLQNQALVPTQARFQTKGVHYPCLCPFCDTNIENQ